MTKKRRRPIHLHVMVSEAEQALIQERMAEAGIRNMGAYMRKMALSGYVLHVDLSPVRELVSLQRRCSNNLNQVAIQANTYGAIYPEELAALQRDYAALWVLEVLRLHREFHLPHPVPADEQEKPLDKVKEPPRACRSREREER